MKLLANNIVCGKQVEVDLVKPYNKTSFEVKYQNHKFIVENRDLEYIVPEDTKFNKTLVRLVTEYVFACEKRRLEILNTKTFIRFSDEFNWIIDRLSGNVYELDKENKYYDKWHNAMILLN